MTPLPTICEPHRGDRGGGGDGEQERGGREGAGGAWAKVLGLESPQPLDELHIKQRIPLMIRLPEGAHARNYSATGGQVDLAPRLLHLFGLKPS